MKHCVHETDVRDSLPFRLPKPSALLVTRHGESWWKCTNLPSTRKPRKTLPRLVERPARVKEETVQRETATSISAKSRAAMPASPRRVQSLPLAPLTHADAPSASLSSRTSYRAAPSVCPPACASCCRVVRHRLRCRTTLCPSRVGIRRRLRRVRGGRGTGWESEGWVGEAHSASSGARTWSCEEVRLLGVSWLAGIV